MRWAIAVAAAAFLVLPGAASAATSNDTVGGIELPSSDITTTGNFAGAASGDLPGLWFAQVVHDPLVYSLNTPTHISGGSFTLLTSTGSTVSSTITTGSVTPTSLPSTCSNQTFTLSLTLNNGTFNGTLTHLRVSLFGSCITFFATVTGSATLNT